jgi:hypothetical protein
MTGSRSGAKADPHCGSGGKRVSFGGEEHDIQYSLYRLLVIIHRACLLGLPAVHFDYPMSQLKRRGRNILHAPLFPFLDLHRTPRSYSPTRPCYEQAGRSSLGPWFTRWLPRRSSTFPVLSWGSNRMVLSRSLYVVQNADENKLKDVLHYYRWA